MLARVHAGRTTGTFLNQPSRAFLLRRIQYNLLTCCRSMAQLKVPRQKRLAEPGLRHAKAR